MQSLFFIHSYFQWGTWSFCLVSLWKASQAYLPSSITLVWTLDELIHNLKIHLMLALIDWSLIRSFTDFCTAWIHMALDGCMTVIKFASSVWIVHSSYQQSGKICTLFTEKIFLLFLCMCVSLKEAIQRHGVWENVLHFLLIRCGGLFVWHFLSAAFITYAARLQINEESSLGLLLHIPNSVLIIGIRLSTANITQYGISFQFVSSIFGKLMPKDFVLMIIMETTKLRWNDINLKSVPTLSHLILLGSCHFIWNLTTVLYWR